jgi:hypothetical protein
VARIVVDQFFATPLEDNDYELRARRLDKALALRGAAWRRSYFSADRKRLTCEFEANNADVIRSAYDEARLEYAAIWQASVSAVEDYPQLLARMRAASL